MRDDVWYLYLSCVRCSSLQVAAACTRARLPTSNSIFVVALLQLLVIAHVKVHFRCFLTFRALQRRVANTRKQIAVSSISLIGSGVSHQILIGRSRPALVSRKITIIFAVPSLLLLQDGLELTNFLELLLNRAFGHIDLELLLQGANFR